MRKNLTLTAAVVLATTALAAAVAWAQDGSNFANTCDVVGSSEADPIYEPAQGHGHPHIFFGAANVANSDTGATLRGRPTSCNRHENFSAYWVPRVYSNGDPLPVDRESKGLGDNTIYYRAGDIADSSTVKSFPSDFEIVARDDGTRGDVRWSCDNTERPLTEAPPERCSTRLLKVNIQFPQCWDGDHVADSERRPEDLRLAGADGNCVFNGVRQRALPQITMSLNFVLPSADVGNITVAGDDGRLPHTSMHADFVNGWRMETLNDLVADCITNVPQGTSSGQKPRNCADPDRF